MNIQEKLFKFMEERKISASALSRETGIPNSTLADILKGKTERIAINVIYPLANFFNCTVDYFVKNEISDPNYGKARDFIVDYYESELINKYRTLDEHGKEVVDTTLELEYKRIKAESDKKKKLAAASHNIEVSSELFPEANDDDEDSRSMPLHLLSASAGAGVFLDDDSFDIVNVGDEVPRSAQFGVRISGDSMEPKYPDGHIAWVKCTPSIDIGQIGLFSLDGQGYIKKLGYGELISLNPSYKPIFFGDDDSFRTFGLVVGVTEDVY